MSGKALIPLVVGSAVGLFAIKLVIGVVQKAQGAQAGNLVNVVVASREIPAYEEIRPEMLRTAKLSKDTQLEGTFAEPKDLAGRVPVVTVYKGMTIVEFMLAPEGSVPGMPSVIPVGHRAVAVKVDEETGGAGFIKPGHRVDVATVMNVRRGNRSEIISRIILQNVEVLAVGQQLVAEGGSAQATLARSITLAVKSEDVAKLHLAATRGKIRLALRSTGDVRSRQLKYTTDTETGEGSPRSGLFASLFHKSKPAAVDVMPAFAAAPPTPTLKEQPWIIELIHGNQVETLQFENSHSTRRLGAQHSARYGSTLTRRVWAPNPDWGGANAGTTDAAPDQDDETDESDPDMEDEPVAEEGA